MSIGTFSVITLLGILVLILLLVKFKWHPVLSIFIVAVGLSLAYGNSALDTFSIVNEAIGGTFGEIFITVLFGAMIAMGIMDTGAVTSIANFFIRVLKGKNMEWATSLTAYIMSIPVFGDITVVLVAPIAAVLGKRSNTSISRMGMMGMAACSMTHGVVPPTPGILAVTLMLGADLGAMILVGSIVCFTALVAIYFLFRKWADKTFIPAKEEFVVGIEPAPAGATVGEMYIKDESGVNAFAAFLPLLLPVLLLSSGTIAKVIFTEGSAVLHFFNIISDRIIAMGSGVVCAALIGLKNRKLVIRNALMKSGQLSTAATKAETDALVSSTSYASVIFQNWVGRACQVALIPLLVTACGGALAGIIKSAAAVETLGEAIMSTGLPTILIPFIISSVIYTACGSQTTAGITTAGIMIPMMPVLGISPLACALAIGCGTLVFCHANDSGFWYNAQFYGLDTKQMFTFGTWPSAVAGVIAFGITVLLSVVGIV